MQTRQQRGFTLIELIMVIAVLGILAAFALPKFADLSKEARIATINGVAAAMRSGSAIAHAASLATQSNSVVLEGSATPYNLVNGYPATADITEIAQVAEGSGMTVTAASGTVAYNASCQVVYTAPAAAGSAPSILVNTSGC